jgi:caa(3)-type oxidase subunit IV
MSMEHQAQVPSRARTYVLTFITLGVLTMIEFGAATLSGGIKLPTLLVLATIKALLVAGVYMHLRYDSPVFRVLVLMGLFCALLLVSIFTIVLNVNWSTEIIAPRG